MVQCTREQPGSATITSRKSRASVSAAQTVRVSKVWNSKALQPASALGTRPGQDAHGPRASLELNDVAHRFQERGQRRCGRGKVAAMLCQ